jgi:hypothetical protein
VTRPIDPRDAGKANVGGCNGFTTLDAYVWQRFGARGAWMISGVALAALALIVAWTFTG